MHDAVSGIGPDSPTNILLQMLVSLEGRVVNVQQEMSKVQTDITTILRYHDERIDTLEKERDWQAGAREERSDRTKRWRFWVSVALSCIAVVLASVVGALIYHFLH